MLRSELLEELLVRRGRRGEAWVLMSGHGCLGEATRRERDSEGAWGQPRSTVSGPPPRVQERAFGSEDGSETRLGR